MNTFLDKPHTTIKINSKYNTPYRMFGVECGKGWENLYKPVLERVDEINNENPEDDPIEVRQVKEHFGELSIYLSRYTDELMEMILDAGRKSRHVCEQCGKSTDGRTVDGWIYQLCDECYDKHINRLNKVFNSYEDKLKSREENISKETD